MCVCDWCECVYERAWYHNTLLVHLSLGNEVVLYCKKKKKKKEAIISRSQYLRFTFSQFSEVFSNTFSAQIDVGQLVQLSGSLIWYIKTHVTKPVYIPPTCVSQIQGKNKVEKGFSEKEKKKKVEWTGKV